MIRPAATFLGLCLTLTLTACGGATCESVQNEIEKIGREIQQDPQKAMDTDTGKKLEALRDQLLEMGCLG